MEYFTLILGIILIAGFSWILVRNSKRSGLINAFLRVDTAAILVIGIYLVFTAVHSLLFTSGFLP